MRPGVTGVRVWRVYLHDLHVRVTCVCACLRADVCMACGRRSVTRLRTLCMRRCVRVCDRQNCRDLGAAHLAAELGATDQGDELGSHVSVTSAGLTRSPQAPHCRRERRLPLKALTPLNSEKFALTGSRTQDLRCYRCSCNH
jgi:hypothetical protein